MDYKEYAKGENAILATCIHTKINSEVRVSSIYRRYGNSNFESWGWETFTWKNDRIESEHPSLTDVEEVLNLHITLFNEYE